MAAVGEQVFAAVEHRVHINERQISLRRESEDQRNDAVVDHVPVDVIEHLSLHREDRRRGDQIDLRFAFEGSEVVAVYGYDDTWKTWAEEKGYIFILFDGE